MTEWPVAEQTKINKPEQKKSCSKGVQQCTIFLYCHVQKINENYMDKRLGSLILLFFSKVYIVKYIGLQGWEKGVSVRGEVQIWSKKLHWKFFIFHREFSKLQENVFSFGLEFQVARDQNLDVLKLLSFHDGIIQNKILKEK